jgi:hypothetical protein
MLSKEEIKDNALRRDPAYRVGYDRGHLEGRAEMAKDLATEKSRRERAELSAQLFSTSARALAVEKINLERRLEMAIRLASERPSLLDLAARAWEICVGTVKAALGGKNAVQG